ncbi:MAG: hypothetical protein U9P49_10890 [Thermodesulfobacteriota bacterium]|nr:hypothetical protein [Thermodesulfobacteriota bacterium]
MKLIHRFCLLLIVVILFPGLVFAVDDFFKYKDVKFHLKGDYQAYGKYFHERDINGYNGNATGTNPITDLPVRLQTDKTERWLEHELRLYPWIVFNDKLEFHMRFDVGKYIFQSDYADRIYTTNDTCVFSNDLQRAKDDYEKIRAEEAYVQMITPVGLFVVGRFEDGNHGIVYGIQLPQIPKWTFAIAWNKKNEGKLDYEKPYIDYLHCPQMDYMDRDDQNEVRAISIWEDKDKGIYSEQWLDFRLGASHSGAKNMHICMPQWKFKYNKDGKHIFAFVGSGMGKIAELTKMPEAKDIKDLVSNGITLASLNPGYDFPQIRVKDMGPPDGLLNTVGVCIIGSYDIGKFSPEVGITYLPGAESYDDVSTFAWDEFEPQGYRTPRHMKTLLLGEIEDKYFSVLATFASQQAYDQDDICFQNLSFVKAGTTYRITDKWEVFGQALAAWRTNTKYYEGKKEGSYWDFFPIMYALNNMTTNADGETIVPFVFKRKDTRYYQSIDNFLGLEIDGRLTYKLFDGLDVSLLGAYFSTGDFYKDVLTPKPYVLQWVDQDAMAPVGSPIDIKGPYGYSTFDLEDAWTIQLKVDFKWEI